MKRASYREGVRWIADNDEPTVLDPGEISGFTTSLLLADLFGVEPERVGRDVARLRQRLARQLASGGLVGRSLGRGPAPQPMRGRIVLAPDTAADEAERLAKLAALQEQLRGRGPGPVGA